MGRINWEELKKEYILGNYKNLKEFAEFKGMKYNSDFRTKASGWRTDKLTTDRRKTDKIVSKTIEKVANKVSTEIANYTVKHLAVSDTLLNKIQEALEDPDELYKIVEKLRTGYGPGDFDEKIVTEKTDTINDVKLLNIVNALDKLQRMQRQTLEIIDAKDKEKLQLEKDKISGGGQDNDQEGINSFIKATTIKEDEIKSMFEGDEDEDIPKEE